MTIAKTRIRSNAPDGWFMHSTSHILSFYAQSLLYCHCLHSFSITNIICDWNCEHPWRKCWTVLCGYRQPFYSAGTRSHHKPIYMAADSNRYDTHFPCTWEKLCLKSAPCVRVVNSHIRWVWWIATFGHWKPLPTRDIADPVLPGLSVGVDIACWLKPCNAERASLGHGDPPHS